MSKQNEQAYPITSEFGPKLDSSPGLTKLELAAMMAMQGLLANNTESYIDASPRIIAEFSLECATALLAELERQQ